MNEVTAPDFIQVDLFCGAGGVTLGTDKSMVDGKKVCETIAAVNHNWKAIKSHWKNHKHVVHYEEDIRTLSTQLDGLVVLVNIYRKLWPNAKVILWASLPCPHFSKAKGGGRKRSDMRTLAWALCKQFNKNTRRFYVGDSYIQRLNPDFIHIENVEEFATWGPLTPQGQVIKERKGEYFRAWCKYINKLGYHMDWRKINAADLGGYTKRTRLFGCFAKTGLPISWPKSTHSKNGDLYTEKWKPVKEVLDFTDEGVSIFPREGGRKKYMSPKTYTRVLAGCKKFIPQDPQRGAFLLKYNSTNQKTGVYIPPDINEPAPVISPQGRLSLVTPVGFQIKYHGNDGKGPNVYSFEDPAGTLGTKDQIGKVHANFLINYQHGSDANSIDEPSPTLVTKDRYAKVHPVWVDRQYGEGGGKLNSIDEPLGTLPGVPKANLVNAHWLESFYTTPDTQKSIEDPCPPITTKPHEALVQASFIDQQYGQSLPISTEEPVGGLTGNPKNNLVQAESFIVPQNYDNGPVSIDEPMQVITANRKHHFLVNPMWGVKQGGSIDNPCFTLIARMDKMPPYLVTTDTGHYAIEVYESDPPIVVELKEFMAANGITDIKMRMLRIPELKKIQGFPVDYYLYGTQEDQKLFIGNSVHPDVPEAWYAEKAKVLRSLLNAA